MKIDLKYMANILGVFLDSEQAHITISDFPMLGIDIEDATEV